jgi:hypothetical protein
LPVPPDLDAHFEMLAHAFAKGRVVPLLGAGVNLCGHPPSDVWDRRFLPDGRQLARELATLAPLPKSESDTTDLIQVSQWVSVMAGTGPLYAQLRDVFEPEYAPTIVHEYLASLPTRLRLPDGRSRHVLVVTTNYDDVLERAFEAAGEPYEVFAYIAAGEHVGKFLHYPVDGGEAILIEVANRYLAGDLAEQSAIVKLHGALDRRDEARDSYVIREDDYIGYLTRADPSQLLPAPLAARLSRSHFLFLGYSLRDWNLRVILHRIWGTQLHSWNSWAVQRDPPELDQKFWEERKVELIDMDLEQYIRRLSGHNGS